MIEAPDGKSVYWLSVWECEIVAFVWSEGCNESKRFSGRNCREIIRIVLIEFVDEMRLRRWVWSF